MNTNCDILTIGFNNDSMESLRVDFFFKNIFLIVPLEYDAPQKSTKTSWVKKTELEESVVEEKLLPEPNVEHVPAEVGVWG